MHLKRIEERHPHIDCQHESFTGTGGSQCIRCGLFDEGARTQTIYVNELHSRVVKLARALDRAIGVLRETGWHVSADEAECTLKEVAGE